MMGTFWIDTYGKKAVEYKTTSFDAKPNKDNPGDYI
jgi:hypothetical protein